MVKTWHYVLLVLLFGFFVSFNLFSQKNGGMWELRFSKEVISSSIDENKRIEMLDKLKALRNVNKFASADWEKRGLNPSPAEQCDRMNNVINQTIDELILAIQHRYEAKTVKKIITKNLSQQDADDFDTEEQEFLCDRFYELAIIVNADIKKDLNKWMYGILGCFL